MTYESNEKHKVPWQRGRRGSLCPKEINPELCQQLLMESQLWPPDSKARFAVWQGRVFKTMEHGNDHWHGWPVGWVEVPEKLRRKFLEEGLVRRFEIRKYWLNSGDDA